VLLECVDFYMLRKRDKDPETELKALIKVSQPGVNRTSVLRPAAAACQPNGQAQHCRPGIT